jgi:hypothetical protein
VVLSRSSLTEMETGIIGLMNGLPPLGAFRRTFQQSITNVLRHRFFHDRLSMTLLAGAGIINGFNLVSLALNVRPTSAEVPIRFSSLTLFDALGPWYYPFLIALFALMATIANGLFAYYSFSRSRITSFFLLMGSGVVAIFSFIISMAFGAVR